MLKSGYCIILTCLLSFDAYAEPTENQLYPYNQQPGAAQDQPYPYGLLPTQVYPNSQQSQDYYPYGQKSSQIYYGYSQVPSSSGGCGCRGR